MIELLLTHILTLEQPHWVNSHFPRPLYRVKVMHKGIQQRRIDFFFFLFPPIKLRTSLDPMSYI